MPFIEIHMSQHTSFNAYKTASEGLWLRYTCVSAQSCLELSFWLTKSTEVGKETTQK